MPPADDAAPMLLRNFTWDDLAAYAALNAATHEAGEGSGPLVMGLAEAFLRQPNRAPERDCFIAEDTGAAAGYALVVPELAIGRTIILGTVHPRSRRRGIGTALLARAIAYSAAMGAAVAHASCDATAVDALQLFAGADFQEVRRQWQMRLERVDYRPFQTSETSPSPRDLTPTPSMGRRGWEGGLQAAYTARFMAAGEEPLMAALQNEVFGGSFGYAPNSALDLAYRVRMAGGTPADVLLLFEGTAPIGYCWTRLRAHPGGAIGEIAMVGSLPSARGRGAGKAVLQAGLESLWRRGAAAIDLTVYADNAPALALYRAAGFRALYEIIWSERRLG